MYRNVRMNFWTDPDIFGLEPLQKLFLLYLVSGPRSNMIGLYVLPLGDAEEDTGVDRVDLQKWLTGTLSRHVTYDFRTREIFVHDMAREQVDEVVKRNDNRIKHIQKQLEGVHSAALKDAFLTRYHDWPLHQAEEAPSKPLRSPSKGATGSPSEAPTRSPFEARSSSSSSTSTEKEGTASINNLAEQINSELQRQHTPFTQMVQQHGIKPPIRTEES